MALTKVNLAKSLMTIALGASVAGVVACETGIDPAILNSAEYQEGYSDGCATAGNQSNGYESEIVENRARSGTNERYIIGWRQGFYACGGQSANSKKYNTREWHHDIGD